MVTRAGRLLERERELERIGALLDAARAGGDGSVLVVEGPAGIGKTRLSRAARQEADLRDFCVVAAPTAVSPTSSWVSPGVSTSRARSL